MQLILHKNFVKKYKKLRENEKQQFKQRRDIFLSQPFHSLLNNHPLRGKYKGCRSINITGDLRLIYKQIDADMVYWMDIDTHSNLYS